MTRSRAQLISGWTDRHVRAALALSAAAIAGAISAAEPPPFHLVSAAVVIATALVALFVDGFGGMVVGVAGAAATIAAKQVAGAWTQQGFVVALALTLALLALGWLAGTVSSDLHGRNARGGGGGGPQAAYGSLGLLDGDAALARLDEEIARARRHRRPLSVAVLRVRITDDTLTSGARAAAERSVARLVETLLPESDVPFALAAGEFGAIMPETSAGDAWDVLGPVLDAADRAAFTVREDNERRCLADCAELHAGVVAMSERLSDSERLIAAARRAAQHGEETAQEHEAEGTGTRA